MRTSMRVTLAILAVLLAVAPAMADEAKTPVSASVLMNILSAPVESRESALDQSMKEDGPAPRSPFVVQPDGSVQYGSGKTTVSVTVKNPCPPGTAHYEPLPLPGRRARK